LPQAFSKYTSSEVITDDSNIIIMECAVAGTVLKEYFPAKDIEATLQLDSVAGALIQDSLWELMQDKITFVIVYQLFTLLLMDRILVFDKGEVVEEGDHDELLAKGNL
jgi:ABC-type transport system involved in Fe-S cluster assembly fused permease/ATPase subunit